MFNYAYNHLKTTDRPPQKIKKTTNPQTTIIIKFGGGDQMFYVLYRVYVYADGYYIIFPHVKN